MARKAQSDRTKKKAVVKLAVHKNKVKRQQQREKRDEMRRVAKSVSGRKDFAGYLIVAIFENGTTDSFYDCGPIIPNVFPHFIKDELAFAMQQEAEAQQEVTP